MYRIDTRLAQRKEPKFSKQSQTQSFSMILSHQSVLKEWCPQRHKESCTLKLVGRHVLCERLPLKDIWRRHWKTDASASSSSTNPIQQKRKDHQAGTGSPVTTRDRVRFDHENTSKHVGKDNVKCDPARTGEPFARNAHLDLAGTGCPVPCDVGTIDCRVH